MKLGNAFRTTLAVVGLLAVAVIGRSAQADVSNNVFTITATNANGSGSWTATLDMGWWDPLTGFYHWDLADAVDIMDDDSGELIASLTDANIMIIEDPQVDLFFSVQASGVDTVFTVSSALLSFPPISPATGQVTLGMTVTDTGTDGATLTGNGPGGGSYLAQYNGFPGGTTFASLMPGLVAGAESSNSGTASVPVTAIGVPVTDISAQFSFILSANDLASGTSSFVVVPTPGALALLGVAGLFGARRRRR